ncbi:enhanced intracellular survival protein Eis [Polymorphospora lycopeni]|uniref:GNAT family N-acetyltransferase n=1 Tax=Polymorphospora lycopeni TaxID=3140240 RepID=A0ABV5CXY5_9ACTN
MRIRRVDAEERLTTAFPLAAYAFESSPPAADRLDRARRYAPYNEDSVNLIAEVDGRTVAAVAGIPMRQNVRGVVHRMAGVAAVVTDPLARRQGHARTLLTRLLGDMRDDGHVVSALYPFRPSFYERFGYAGMPRARRATFAPADLAGLQRADLPGEVDWGPVADRYDDFRDLTLRLLGQRHGFAVFPERRGHVLRDLEPRWLATARVDGEVVGALTYRIEGYGGELVGDDLLVTGPLGRALLLRFLARHVDQVSRASVLVGADDVPELWVTDLAARTEADVSFPRRGGPMARVLSLEALAGVAAGPGRVAVEVVDDPFVAGRYVLDGGSGRLEVTRGDGPAPAATLTVAGLSGLFYGVLDPVEARLRGLGTVPDDAAAQLRLLFPRQIPYLFADF